mgnify:CR=1 FL=1|jgi:integrase|tara:strand:+ start:78 stop:437 length:360 start_codon:yes stop_codon:yes gene_type:complete
MRLALGLGRAEDALVACDIDGSPMKPGYLTREFGRQFTMINNARLSSDEKTLPRIRFHDLRHTHISHLLLNGEHPKIASERAGHASVSITMDIYSHVLPGMQEGAADRINRLLRTASKH